jgi:demethylmenaquinone methyltransferase/2-methoxy-6-polyprenyl-1,4-benzoquinol methylase
MSDLDASLRRYYAARASEYEKIYERPDRQQDLRTLEQWLPPRFAGKRVLEVAIGTGYWTRFFAPVVSELVGVDCAAETLQIARSRVDSANVKFVLGDAYHLPAELAPFAASFAGFWFSHVPRRRQREFLEGLARVMAPGARVVLLDNFYVPGKSSEITETDAEGNTFQARALEDGSIHRVLKNFPDEAELTRLIDGLGQEAAYHRFGYYWVFEYSAR